MKAHLIIIVVALLAQLGNAAAHPNHSCHSHANTERHCK